MSKNLSPKFDWSTYPGAEREKMKGLSLHTFIDGLQAGLGDIHTQIQKNWFY